METNSNSPYQSPNELLNSLKNGGYEAPVMSIVDWLITMVVMAIPLVNLIMLFVWGFGSGSNPNRANFCKAYLVMMVIIIVLYIIFFALFGAALGSMVR